jgi:hypothetical protein
VLATGTGEVLDGVTSREHARRLLECLAVQAPGPADPDALQARVGRLAFPGAAVVIAAGPSTLVGAVRRAVGRPVTTLDATDAGALGFYEHPG